jgi:hypothetical protein
MRDLLRVLADWLAFFFQPPGYRLSDSTVSSGFGDASITLSGPIIVWRLVRDRAQIFLECRPRNGPPHQWYSTDILIRHLEGRAVQTAELTAETADWISRHLAGIEAGFAPGAVAATVSKLEQLKRERADERFGPLPR